MNLPPLSRRMVIGSSLAAALAAPGRASAQGTDEEVANKEVMRRLFDDIYTNGNLAVVTEILSEDFVTEGEIGDPGIEPFKQQQNELRAFYSGIFQSFRWEVTDIAAEGDLVFVRSTFVGQRTDPALAEVTTTAFVEAQLLDRKIVRIWSLVDSQTLTDQLAGR